MSVLNGIAMPGMALARCLAVLKTPALTRLTRADSMVDNISGRAFGASHADEGGGLQEDPLASQAHTSGRAGPREGLESCAQDQVGLLIDSAMLT